MIEKDKIEIISTGGGGTAGPMGDHGGAGAESRIQVLRRRDLEAGGLIAPGAPLPPYALTDEHVAELERAIRAEGYDILVDTETGAVRLTKTPEKGSAAK